MIAEQPRRWSFISIVAFIPRVLIPLFLVVLTVFFAKAMGFAVYDTYFSQPTMAKVPDVQGKDVQQAEDMLKKMGLQLDIQETRYQAKIPKNQVIKQDPPPQRDVREGRKVAVVVSLGPELVEVPKVTDMGVSEARIALENAKLNTGKIKRVEKNKGDPETVLEQHPAAGERVKKGTKIDLVANIGDVAKIKVPNYEGQALDKVRESITWSNLKMGEVQWIVHPSIAPGTIIRQDPPAKEAVEPNTEVDFKVSVGPDIKDQELRQKNVVVHAADETGPQEIRVTVTDGTGTYDVYQGTHYAGETVNVLVTTMGPGEYTVTDNDKLLSRKKL
jgi:serine/threonine-protein kinase